MRLLIAIGCLLILLSGCATMGLDADATQEQRNAAMCKDAELGILTAQVAIQTAPPATLEFWNRYLGAAWAIKDIYCKPVLVAGK